MDPFFFVTLPDGTKQRLIRFDDMATLPPALTNLLGVAAPQDLIRLPVGRNVTLMQAGTTLDAGKTVLPAITSSDDHVVKVGRTVRRSANEQAVEVSAIGEGFAWLSCMAGADSVGTSLGVCVGKFENHTGMTIDMIADAFRNGDAVKIVQLQRLLDNNFDNLFNENSAANERQWGPLACGTVAKVGGIKSFSSKTDYSYHSYHMPLRKVESRSDVTYRPGVVAKAAAAIKAKLKTGVPVLVGVVYSPSTAMLSGGELEVTRGGGHTVLIVGCDDAGTKFLYIDPYPQVLASDLRGRDEPGSVQPDLQFPRHIRDRGPVRTHGYPAAKRRQRRHPERTRGGVRTEGLAAGPTQSRGRAVAFRECVAGPFTSAVNDLHVAQQQSRRLDQFKYIPDD